MDFDEVADTLAVLEKVEQKDIRYRLLRDIAVSYARPFSKNRGNQLHTHTCPQSFVPKQLRDLHKELITLRDERFAHSDLKRIKPKLGRWKTKSGFVYPMSFRGLNYGSLESRIGDIKKLVRNIRDRLQTEINSYQARLDRGL
ncbi:MAG: hypothetical protein E6Q43_02065 [Dokdonella sp.]|nr:MAG: hypothetical protein E6Q43_02065 [Dokdonella sp.]